MLPSDTDNTLARIDHVPTNLNPAFLRSHSWSNTEGGIWGKMRWAGAGRRIREGLTAGLEMKVQACKTRAEGQHRAGQQWGPRG